MGGGCFNFYIFNRHGTCLYYQEWFWATPRISKFASRRDEEKQIFGLFWTLKNFTAALDPKDEAKPKLGCPVRIGESCSFYSFKTNVYRLHFLESLSGLKFIMNTSPDLDSSVMQDVMASIYNQLFVEYVVKNPFYTPGDSFTFEEFGQKLDKFLKNRGILKIE